MLPIRIQYNIVTKQSGSKIFLPVSLYCRRRFFNSIFFNQCVVIEEFNHHLLMRAQELRCDKLTFSHDFHYFKHVELFLNLFTTLLKHFLPNSFFFSTTVAVLRVKILNKPKLFPFMTENLTTL